MSTKKEWNIWDIKNRWLRALVAWASLLAFAVIVAVVAPLALLAFAVVGAFRGIRDEFADALDGTIGWRGIWSVAWKALTAQDQPEQAA